MLSNDRMDGLFQATVEARGDRPGLGSIAGGVLQWHSWNELRQSVGHVGAGTMSTRDVAGIGQTTIDGPDRVGVHSECRSQFPDGGQARTRQEPTGVDLVGELPVDLGRDGDVGIAFDVKAAAGSRPHRGPGAWLVD
jgi:hypothetical protein